MSHIVTHTECVNRMAVVKDTERERSAMELRAIQSLPSAMAEYLARGGKVTELPPMTMQDPQSSEAVQLRKDTLRQYDLSHERKAMKAARRG